MQLTLMRSTSYCRGVFSFLLTLSLLGFLAACASSPDHPDWIRIGVTTKDDVIARYGQPDVVMTTPGGETDIYHEAPADASVPRLQIPTIHAGPAGTSTTRTESIDPFLGAKELDTDSYVSVKKELRIHYDARGVVQTLSASP